MRRAAKPARATADALFSKIVRLRDGWCRVCGTTERLQCAHLVSRRYGATRFDEANAWALCVSHHKYYTDRPLEWDVYVEQQIGVAAWTRIKTRALMGLNGRTDYKALCASLRMRLEELEMAA